MSSATPTEHDLADPRGMGSVETARARGLSSGQAPYSRLAEYGGGGVGMAPEIPASMRDIAPARRRLRESITWGSSGCGQPPGRCSARLVRRAGG